MPLRGSPNGASYTRPQPGRHRSEQVVAINRNRWSRSIGTGGRNQPECAILASSSSGEVHAPPCSRRCGLAVQCPFCFEEVKPDALVCRTCTRDITVPKPLMEANARLTARVAELEAELAVAQAGMSRPLLKL